MGKGASFRIDADVSPYEEAMQRAMEATASAAESIKTQFEGVNKTFETMKGVFETAMLALGGGELANKLGEIAERAAGIRETAETFNLTTEALQGMQVMANEAGVSSDKFSRTMATLEQKMRSAGEEGGKAAEEFNRLGITTEQLQDPAFTVQEAFEKLGASSNSNAELIQLLGARGAQLIPVLREMATNHDAVGEAAKKVGAITNAEAGAMAAYRGEAEEASTAWANFSTRISMALLPALDAAATKMAEWSSKTENTEMVANVFKAVIDAIGTAFFRIVEGGRIAIDVFVGMLNIGVDVFQTLGAVIDGFIEGPLIGIGLALKDLKAGNFSNIGADLMVGIKTAAVNVTAATAQIGADFNNMVAYIGDDTKEATQNIQAMTDILSAPPKVATAPPPASTAMLPDMSKESKSIEDMINESFDKIAREVQEKMKGAFSQIATSAADSAKQQETTQVGSIDRQIAAVQELGRTHQLSASQELTQETSLLNQKWAAQQSYYDMLKTLYANNVDKLAQVNTQEEAAWQKHLAEMQKAQQQATNTMAQQWQRIGSSIASSFSSAIDGMITKHRTFTQTALQLGESLVTGLINNFVKMAVSWAEQEVMKMIASRTAAEGVVASSAGAAGAAGTASFAAAPWPIDLGAAAYGAAMAATAASFAVAEHGYDIPAGVNPKTQLHEREMVLPADLADSVRQMSGQGGRGGAGGNFHAHFHGTDPKAMERMANNSASTFHRAAKGYYKRGGR